MWSHKIIGTFLCLCTATALTTVYGDDAQSGFSYADYVHAKRDRRELAIEFMDFYQNYTKTINGAVNSGDVQCLADLQALMSGIEQGSIWAMRFIDAWGNLPAGILYGNLKDLGNFDECLKISHNITSNHAINGKYCLAKLPLGELLAASKSLVIHTAICLPATCSASRMDAVLKLFFQQYLGVDFGTQSLVPEDTCQTNASKPLSALAIVTIVILSIFGVLTVLSTLYDYFVAKAGADLNPCVQAFSARVNGRQLFRLNVCANPNVVPSLHGIRCLSLVWVVFGHDYMIAVFSPNMNQATVYTWLESPFSMLIQHALFSVDTFFFLSGLLVVMLALRDMDKQSGKLRVGLMYIHRFLRLTPMLALAVMVYMSIGPLLGNGPLWGTISFDNYKACTQTWWQTLLYVQNYATEEMCVEHTWYLAVDMQLFLLSPLLLIPLWKWGKKAVAGIVVVLLLLSTCLFSMIIMKHYTTHIRNIKSSSMRPIYFTTHTRTAPWLIGTIFGYFMHTNKARNFKLSKLMVWLGWLVSLGLLMTCMFSLYSKMQWDAPRLTSLDEAFYVTLTRIAWPLALCWVVFACQFGYGGMANSILATPLWQPLSKISFCAYIWHMLIINTNGERMRASTYFSNYDVMLRFWADFGFTVLLSVLMYLMVESPLATLEMHFLPNRKKQPEALPPKSNNIAHTETAMPPTASSELYKPKLDS